MDDEFSKFLTYLKTLEEKIVFLFTVKQGKNTVFIQECMEQYFFMRKIYAKIYTVLLLTQAQKQVVLGILNKIKKQ